jgi:hypothetical protein
MFPVLILCYKRFNNLEKILKVLSYNDGIKVYINIDGPKNEKEFLKTNKVKEIALNWSKELNITILENDINLGIRAAIPKALNTVFIKENELIVLEEDALPSEYFYAYANKILENREILPDNIAHVSFYNCVPNRELANSNAPLRLSFFPESYAWATWKNCWELYEDSAKFNGLPNELNNKLNKPLFGRIVWNLNSILAKYKIIDTWAYRWIFSLWNHEKLCLSVNSNLIKYQGSSSGSHTILKQTWAEIECGVPMLLNFNQICLDTCAENWLAKNVFNHNLSGILKLIMSIFLRKFIFKLSFKS